MQKKAVTVYIQEDILDSFRELVKAKYKGLTGMSYETQQAMAFWLASQRTQTQAQSQSTEVMNPIPRVFAVANQIREFFRKKYGYQPQQVSLFELREAIGMIRGNDPRTIERWLKEFAKYKVIKPLAPNVYELP